RPIIYYDKIITRTIHLGKFQNHDAKYQFTVESSKFKVYFVKHGALSAGIYPVGITFKGVIKNFTVHRLVRRVSGVSVTQTQNELIEDKPLQQDFGFRSRADLETAIQRSQNYLLREQKPEGYWIGEL